MGKIKLFSGKKRCKDGETYNFKKGIAVVPGIRISGKNVRITLLEFIQFNKI